MSYSKETWKYIITDFLTAALVWFAFNVLRYYQQVVFRDANTLDEFLLYPSVWLGQVFIPFYWLVIYYFSGYYNKSLAKSRLSEFWVTLISSVIGVFGIFMFLILNELPIRYQIYYYFFFELLGLHFTLTYLFRLRLTMHLLKRIQRGDFAIHVLVLGIGEKALLLSQYLEKVGTKVTGFVRISSKEDLHVNSEQILGNSADLPDLMKQYPIEELVVATDALDETALSKFLYSLYQYKKPIKVWIDKKTILFSKVRLKTISAVPLAEITENNFSEAEKKEAVKKSCQRTFQALRIDINSEFEVLYAFLDKLPGALKPGGRAAILTFHSGEDRLVKKAFKEGLKAGIYSEINQDVIRPSAEECAKNGRAKSTKLRWAVKAQE